MTQPAEAGAWHGWTVGDQALFISPTPGEEHIGIYLQQGRSTELAGVFTDPAMAQMVMDFLDSTLTATANANAELLQRLEHEQPLFAQARSQVDLDVEEDDDAPG